MSQCVVMTNYSSLAGPQKRFNSISQDQERQREMNGVELIQFYLIKTVDECVLWAGARQIAAHRMRSLRRWHILDHAIAFDHDVGDAARSTQSFTRQRSLIFDHADGAGTTTATLQVLPFLVDVIGALEEAFDAAAEVARGSFRIGRMRRRRTKLLSYALLARSQIEWHATIENGRRLFERPQLAHNRRTFGCVGLWENATRREQAMGVTTVVVGRRYRWQITAAYRNGTDTAWTVQAAQGWTARQV